MIRVLRQYQRGGIDRTKELLAYNPLFVSPTGSGKTFALATMVEELRRPTLWVAHRRELIDQAHRQLCGLGLRAGVIMAGEPENKFAQVQVASVSTLARRGIDITKDWLIIIDEAHHAAAASYRSLFETGAPVVGATATPFRLDGAGLGELFGSMVVAATTKELVEQGFLVRPKVLCAPAPAMDGVKVTAGEFNISEAASKMDTGRLVGDIVKTWLERSDRGRTLGFAVNIEHSKHLVAEFLKAGVPAAHVDGDTDVSERDLALSRLRSGELLVVFNVQLFTEGWDLPALSNLIMAKPTASLCLHQQMVGRVVRAHGDKTGALILDHAGNHLRHGEITREIEYSLEPRSNATAGPKLGVRVCPKCYALFSVGTFECPECGNNCRPAPPEIQHEPGNLRDYIDTTFEGKAKEWAKIEAVRVDLKFGEAWSYNEFRRRFGHWPLVVAGALVDPARATLEQRIAVWTQIDEERKTRMFERGWTDHRYKAIFGGFPTPDVRTAHSKVKVAEFADRQPPRQWSGKAKVAGEAPSKRGATENPFVGETSSGPRKPWQRVRPTDPNAFSTVEDAAAFLIEKAGKFGEVFIRNVLDNELVLREVYRTAARVCHPDAGGNNEDMVRVNVARNMIETEIPF